MEINILNIIFLAIILILVLYIIILKNKNSKLLTNINDLLDSAINNNIKEISYSENEYSKIEFKLKKFIDNNENKSQRIIREENNIKSLISNISHQSKNPISNILLYSELLKENYNEEYLNIIISQVNKLSFLIDSLLKSSRLENGFIDLNIKNEEILPILQNIILDLKPKSNNKKIFLDNKNYTVLIDYKWTEEAILNIIDNAIKYSYDNSNIYIKLSNTNNFIKIDIISKGENIKEEDYNNIFKRFYRNKIYRNIDGLGIGLYLSRLILDKESGYISLSSKNHINTFSVFLPINSYKSVSF